MNVRLMGLIFLCGVAAVLGCVKLQQPQVEKSFYDIQTQRPQPATSAPLAGPVRVQRLNISPRYAGREMVYRTGEFVYKSDFYNVYFVPPADMLTQDLRRWLEASKIFSFVLDPSSLVPVHYSMEGNIVALYGDFTQSPARAVVKMQVFLVDMKSAQRAILFASDYMESVVLTSKLPAAVAQGLSRATAAIFTQLEADLRQQSW